MGMGMHDGYYAKYKKRMVLRHCMAPRIKTLMGMMTKRTSMYRIYRIINVYGAG